MNSEFNHETLEGEISDYCVLSDDENSLIFLVSTFQGGLFKFNYEKNGNDLKKRSIDLKENCFISSLAKIDEEIIAISTIDQSESKIVIFNLSIEQSLKEKSVDSAILRLIPIDNSQFASFDSSNNLKFWKLRSNNNFETISSLVIKGIVESISLKKSYIMICSHLCTEKSNHLLIIDTNDKSITEDLKINFQAYSNANIISFDINPAHNKVCFGLTDGRVIDFAKNTIQSSSLELGNVYKAHHDETKKIGFPVVAAKFHPFFEGIVLSGGADGRVTFFDDISKKIYKELSLYNKPISFLNFSKEGDILMIFHGNELKAKDNDNISNLVVIPLNVTYFPVI